MFIRLPNSSNGYWDVELGAQGSVLTSNGDDVAPTFASAAAGSSLVRGFSYTQEWEQAELERYGGYDFGLANFTAEFERTAAEAAMGTAAHGPASYSTMSDHPWAKRV